MEKMSSGVWQMMDVDHGDLADVVRRSAIRRCRESPRGEMQAPDIPVLTPQETNYNFGDPILDPLLPELGGGGTNFCGANMEPDFGRGEDFPRAIQISSSKKYPAPLVSSSHAILCGDVGSSPISYPASPDIKRKSQTKKVVCIPAQTASGSRPGGDVIPPDLWAWRKYGQKPIKGSPYPRGYYKCSSSKGCSARKQVERSRSDPSMLVITYASEHNHPWPTQKSSLAGSSRAQLARSGAAAINGGFSLNQEIVPQSAGFITGLRELGLAGEERRSRSGATADQLSMIDLRGRPFSEAYWGL